MNLNQNKSSISRTTTYKEIGDFWDTHEISDVWEKAKEASFDVDIESEVTYYAVDNALS